MNMIQNPILPGFHPDPAIIRVGDDYYLATSSFEWFPGVPIYHSRDLVNWELATYALKSKKYLDLTGERASRGVWAPCLSYDEHQKRFYLVYSNVHCQNPWLFDVDNFLIWTEDILGEWSDPVYLNSSGFDPSFFHDDDGSIWMLNKDRDFRPENLNNRSIIIQQFDMDNYKLLGNPTVISRGFTKRSYVEGAHMFKKDGWYYLITAEGGTGYGHGVVLARSRSVTGPFEPSPVNPILTSNGDDFESREGKDTFMMPDRYNPAAELQKAGHGSLVQTQNGEWYMAHLCGRPVMPEQRCILGRETGIQKMEWTDDGWLRMADGSNIAKGQAPAPALPAHPFPPIPAQRDFDGGKLDPEFNTTRNEITPDWADLASQKGYLKLRGRDSLTSPYDVSLIARRLQHFNAEVSTLLEFSPTHYHHLAGLTCFYDTESHFCAYKTYDDVNNQEVLGTYAFIGSQMLHMEATTPVPAGAPVWLKATIATHTLQFSYSLDGKTFQPLGKEEDITVLSDEASKNGVFTGTFVGMFAQDTHTKSNWAAFDCFRYEPVGE